MKYLLLLLSILATYTTNAQNPTDYYSYSHTVKEEVYIDNFDDDTDTTWVTSHKCERCGNREVKIENGHLSILNNIKDKGYDYYAECTNIDLDDSRNFEIAFRVRAPYKGESAYRGMFKWGLDSNNYGNKMFFTACGFLEAIYSVATEKKGKKILRKSKYIPAYNGYLTFTIRKVKKYYYIFCNKTYIGKGDFYPFRGDEFCLGGKRKKLVKYDFIKIHYLP